MAAAEVGSRLRIFNIIQNTKSVCKMLANAEANAEANAAANAAAGGRMAAAAAAESGESLLMVLELAKLGFRICFGVFVGQETRRPIIHSTSLDRHCLGEYSLCSLQTKSTIEVVKTKVETSRIDASFFSISDGYGGPEGSTYLQEHLFENILELSKGDHDMSAAIIKQAYIRTGTEFLAQGRTEKLNEIRGVEWIGSCCLFGLIWDKALYVANLGDSIAVIGIFEPNASEVRGVRLNVVHEADRFRKIRKTDDRQKIKGQCTTMLIGESFVMDARRNVYREDQFGEGSRGEQLDVVGFQISSDMKFVILGSRGMWKLCSERDAVAIVNGSPKEGVAKRLVEAALRNAGAARRDVQSDISVFVVFFDAN